MKIFKQIILVVSLYFTGITITNSQEELDETKIKYILIDDYNRPAELKNADWEVKRNIIDVLLISQEYSMISGRRIKNPNKNYINHYDLKISVKPENNYYRTNLVLDNWVTPSKTKTLEKKFLKFNYITDLRMSLYELFLGKKYVANNFEQLEASNEARANAIKNAAKKRLNKKNNQKGNKKIKKKNKNKNKNKKKSKNKKNKRKRPKKPKKKVKKRNQKKKPKTSSGSSSAQSSGSAGLAAKDPKNKEPKPNPKDNDKDPEQANEKPKEKESAEEKKKKEKEKEKEKNKKETNKPKDEEPAKVTPKKKLNKNNLLKQEKDKKDNQKNENKSADIKLNVKDNDKKEELAAGKKVTPSDNFFSLSLNYYKYHNTHSNYLLSSEIDLKFLGITAFLERIEKTDYPWAHQIEINTAAAIEKQNFPIPNLKTIMYFFKKGIIKRNLYIGAGFYYDETNSINLPTFGEGLQVYSLGLINASFLISANYTILQRKIELYFMYHKGSLLKSSQETLTSASSSTNRYGIKLNIYKQYSLEYYSGSTLIIGQESGSNFEIDSTMSGINLQYSFN